MNGQKAPTWVKETYEMLAMPPAPPCEKSRWSVQQSACADRPRPGVVVVQMNTTHIKKPTGEGPEPGPGGEIDPTAPDDVTVTENGRLELDAQSGFMVQGEAHQQMVGKARHTQVFINGELQAGASLETRMRADTTWSGDEAEIPKAKGHGMRRLLTRLLTGTSEYGGSSGVAIAEE